ncbi:hypothetical protein [Paraburkholderia humisilvae]|uniref:Uncharacterized protein n=1 Tax=Paraburkholderia humisilvae TaxID=627669 RepID=A0A6J5F8T4_9BURK|nr:hypothetical protein [Paraburkholderia humisilvae]CAB3775250.1 hypothetical protein LMG29542_08632 [Paraburkholderia humisilvae]
MEYNFAFGNSGVATNGAASGSYDYGAASSGSAMTPLPVTFYSYSNPHWAVLGQAARSRADSAGASHSRAFTVSQSSSPSVDMAHVGDAELGPELPDNDKRKAYYRADRRPLAGIFRAGLYTKGFGQDVERHVRTNYPCDLVSLTPSSAAAIKFATEKSGAKNIVKVGIEIGSPSVIDVNKFFKEELGKKNPHSEEQEHVHIGDIPASKVFGGQRINMAGQPVGPFECNKGYK